MQSSKLNQLPPYLFAGMDRKKRELIAGGADLIDLSVGDPDLPTPKHIVDALERAARNPKNHRYAPYNGTRGFREAAAAYLAGTCGARLDPETEILALIGSKEGIAHLIFSAIDHGDVVLAPSPGYPVYSNAAILAGGTPFELPLLKENNFLPDLDAIPPEVAKKAKLLFINYPNNPTSAVATAEFFERAVDFARRNKILICHDAAYNEVVADACRSPSILEAKGAKEVAVEFYSLSKTYNMTGWRLGFAAGNKDAIASLGKFKTHVDSSATAFVQEAGAVALSSDQSCVKEMRAVYQKRRDILVSSLEKIGFDVFPAKATFYVWAWLKPNALNFGGEVSSVLLEKAHVAATPGEGFGRFGKGFIRFSLTSPTERIEEAVARISRLI